MRSSIAIPATWRRDLHPDGRWYDRLWFSPRPTDPGSTLRLRACKSGWCERRRRRIAADSLPSGCKVPTIAVSREAAREVSIGVCLRAPAATLRPADKWRHLERSRLLGPVHQLRNRQRNQRRPVRAGATRRPVAKVLSACDRRDGAVARFDESTDECTESVRYTR